MKTFFLLHGAMRGAWLWHRSVPLLEQAGAAAVAYDLPGHGKRASERAGITMSSYVEDVKRYIEARDLRDLVLVGHSMSGIVISRLAEEMPSRISRLVYCAAVVPQDGDALIDLLPRERQESLRRLEGTTEPLFGPLEALRPNYFTDLTGPEQDGYLRQLTPQPIAVFFEKMSLRTFSRLGLPRTYLLGLRDKALPPELTRGFAARLGVRPVEIDAGHDMMVVKPEEVVRAMVQE